MHTSNYLQQCMVGEILCLLLHSQLSWRLGRPQEGNINETAGVLLLLGNVGGLLHQLGEPKVIQDEEHRALAI